MKADRFCRVIAGCVLRLCLCAAAWGQCGIESAGGQADAQQIEDNFDKQNWAEVVRLAQGMNVRPAEVNFEYGLALAHLGELPQARTALMDGARACPREKRFDLELAGVAFEEKRNVEAAAWLRRALKLDPHDEYSNNFAGTVYLLMGNVDAALKYWNRVQKPYVNEMDLDSQLKVQRLILDRAFAFSPAAVGTEREFETTQARLDGLGIFSRYNMELNARADGKFDVKFHGQERNGFGNGWAGALVSTFGGAVYGTIYPSYLNIRGSAMNVESLFRWDAQKRRAWLEVSAPMNDRPEFRWRLSADGRNENWAIRRSFTGTAPVLGALNLERQEVAGSLTGIRSGRLQWSAGAELSHRNYRNVVDGTALVTKLTEAGYELKAVASVDGMLVRIPERRFTVLGSARQEFGRLWASGTGTGQSFEKLQGSATAKWFPQAEGENYEVEGRVRAGHTFGSAPFDELFLLGMERDTDLWMRGQIGTRDGKKGSSPLGSRFFLANADFYRCVWGNGLVELKAGPLADFARVGAPTAGLSDGRWMFDVGAGAKITVLGTSVVLTYGHDLRTGSNAFFGSELR